MQGKFCNGKTKAVSSMMNQHPYNRELYNAIKPDNVLAQCSSSSADIGRGKTMLGHGGKTDLLVFHLST